MIKLFTIFISLLVCFSVNAVTFKKAVEMLKLHDSIKEIEFSSKALKAQGGMYGSWGDPVFKVSAKNFPKDSMKDDETAMTGVEFGLSQTMALTTKYGHVKDSYLARGNAKLFDSKKQISKLVRMLWSLIIDSKRISEEIKILKKNLEWTSKNVKVSKKLYSNGKISQQALLEIQIRKSEIEAEISNKEFEMKEHNAHHDYLFGSHAHIEESSIPWKLLRSNLKNKSKMDLKELSLKSVISAKNSLVTSKNLNYIPDLTLTAAYTKRSNFDDNGDFISFSVSFPLPTSSTKYAAKSTAVYDRAIAKHKLADYISYRDNEIRRITYIKEKIESELKILKSKTIKFADSSRRVTSKSYSLGQASYLEVLQSELKLQQLLIKKIRLESKRLSTIADLKYTTGEKLYE
jgi:hypothetical protein